MVSRVKIELDGISLSETQGGEDGVAEARSVANVRATDSRNVLMHAVPGMEGSAIQDLGRTAVLVTFDGIIMGAGAKGVVEMLRSKFKRGEPLPFISDVSGMADVSKVVIEDLRVTEAAGNRGRYDYSIRLKEFTEPPAQQTAPPPQDGQAEQWADAAADEADRSLNALAGRVLDANGEPMAGVTVKATMGGEEYTATTDGEGNYKIEDLAPGDYEVTADARGFEGLTQRISVGREGGGAGPEAPPEEGAGRGQEPAEEEPVAPTPTVQ